MVVRAEFETFPAKAGRSPRVYLVENTYPLACAKREVSAIKNSIERMSPVTFRGYYSLLAKIRYTSMRAATTNTPRSRC